MTTIKEAALCCAYGTTQWQQGGKYITVGNSSKSDRVVWLTFKKPNKRLNDLYILWAKYSIAKHFGFYYAESERLQVLDCIKELKLSNKESYKIAKLRGFAAL